MQTSRKPSIATRMLHAIGVLSAPEPSGLLEGVGPRTKSKLRERFIRRYTRSAYMPHQGGGRAALDRPEAMARKNAA